VDFDGLERGAEFVGNHIQERFVVEGLGEEVDAPLFHGLDALGDCSVCRDEDHFLAPLGGGEFSLQGESIKTRENRFEHDATGSRFGRVGEKRRRSVERCDRVALGAESIPDAGSRGCVVIDQNDPGAGRGRHVRIGDFSGR
jgi:hypothetical protein